jgi:D-alanine--poly(phosphoribitol) ligase subunit 2
MERLLEILEEIQPDIDYATCTDLVDGHLLDSLSILALVAELEDAFDITIPAVEITPSNFNSAAQIWAMILRLGEEA